MCPPTYNLESKYHVPSNINTTTSPSTVYSVTKSIPPTLSAISTHLIAQFISITFHLGPYAVWFTDHERLRKLLHRQKKHIKSKCLTN